MTRSRQLALCLAASLLASTAMAEDLTPQYQVSSEITLNGKPFAQPSLIVLDDAEGVISTQGADGYQFVLSVDGDEWNHVILSIDLRTSGARLETEVRAILGKPMVISSGDLGLKIVVQPLGGP